MKSRNINYRKKLLKKSKKSKKYLQMGGTKNIIIIWRQTGQRIIYNYRGNFETIFTLKHSIYTNLQISIENRFNITLTYDGLECLDNFDLRKFFSERTLENIETDEEITFEMFIHPMNDREKIQKATNLLNLEHIHRMFTLSMNTEHSPLVRAMFNILQLYNRESMKLKIAVENIVNPAPQLSRRPNDFPIVVKSYTHQFNLYVLSTDTIYDIKKTMLRFKFSSINDIDLRYNGRLLENERSIFQYNIQRDSEIEILVRSRFNCFCGERLCSMCELENIHRKKGHISEAQFIQEFPRDIVNSQNEITTLGIILNRLESSEQAASIASADNFTRDPPTIENVGAAPPPPPRAANIIRREVFQNQEDMDRELGVGVPEQHRQRLLQNERERQLVSAPGPAPSARVPVPPARTLSPEEQRQIERDEQMARRMMSGKE